MSDFPRNPAVPTHIHTWSKYMIGLPTRTLQTFSTPAAIDWTANVAIFIPLYLPWAYNVRRVFAVCGNTVSGGNIDIGIYTVKGGKLYSTGSTSLTGGSSSTPLYVTPATDILLPPGAYLMGYACDTGGGASSRAYGISMNANMGRMIGVYRQATAFPLPSPPTFAAYDGVSGCPLIGITNTPSGF